MFYALCQRIIEVVSNFPSSIELHLPWIFLILHLWMVVHPYILNIALPLMFSICASSLMITGCFQNLLLRLICDLYYHHVRCQQTWSLTYTFDTFDLYCKKGKEKMVKQVWAAKKLPQNLFMSNLPLTPSVSKCRSFWFF